MAQLVPHRNNFGRHAPIVEALIDLAAPATADIADLRALANELAVEFPFVVEQTQWDVAFKLDPNDASAPTRSAVPRGFMLHSADRSRAVQVRRDGFTMSHLRPYKTWDDLRADASALWPRYVAAAKVATLPRIAVRYINRLELPPDKPLQHWLDLMPQTPSGLQQEPAEFALRTVYVHPENGALAVVQLVQEYAEPTQPRVLVFDIDCFFQGLSLSPTDPAIWGMLDDLREFKNDIFFGSITANTEELFR